MLSVGAITLEKEVRLGIQVLVEGEQMDVQEFIRILSMFLQLLVPAMMTLVSMHEGYISLRLAWGNFLSFNRPAVELPFEWQPLSFSFVKTFFRALPVLLFVFAGALFFGLVK
jgi:hypothetical protein